MPIEWVDAGEISGRESKVSKTKEGKEIIDALGVDGAGMKPGKVMRVTFSPETMSLFKGSAQKTAFAFALKLRKLYPNLTIKLINGTEIHISARSDSGEVANLKKQKGA